MTLAAMAEMVTSQETDPGGWLVEHRWEMDRGESSWLEALAVFDRDQGWAADGQLNAADWLVWRTDMARATAYEKLRIAHQLSRRPLVAAAFADGRLSYSAVRAIARVDDPDPDTDIALIDVAVAGSVADVERVVRVYQLHADQHRPPAEAEQRRGVRIIRGLDGTGRIEVTATDVEVEEFAVTSRRSSTTIGLWTSLHVQTPDRLGLWTSLHVRTHPQAPTARRNRPDGPTRSWTSPGPPWPTSMRVPSPATTATWSM